MRHLLLIFAISILFLLPIVEPEIKIDKALRPPNAENPFGTDQLGRDILARILLALRLDLVLGALVVVISSSIGILLGLLASHFSTVDKLVIFITDVFLALPELVFALVLVGILGPGIESAVIALTAFGWMRYSRTVRGIGLFLKESGFVELLKAIGASDSRIIFRHVFPNTLPRIIPLFAYHYGHAIVSFAALSFLGLGAQPPVAELGAMLSEGKNYMFSAPWLVFFPTTVIVIVVAILTFLGNRLEANFSPRRVSRW